jgi:hypothetical protein
VVGLAGCNTRSEQENTTTETQPAPTTSTDTPSSTESSSNYQAVAEEFTTRFINQEFSAASELLNGIGKSSITGTVLTATGGEFNDVENALERLWLAATGQHGSPQSIGKRTVSRQQGRVDQLIEFDQGQTQLRLFITDDQAVRQLQVKEEYSLPSYQSKASRRREAVSFTTDSQTFNGELVIPTQAETDRVPCVVLLQGLGVSDRNSTVGPNQIFKDLAYGLADRGIATYRFDKRRPSGVDGEFTPTNLFINDTINALDTVQDHQMIRSDAVYLGGHSLGGMWAPQIAVKHGGLAGMLLFDAVSFPFVDQIIKSISSGLDKNYLLEKEKEELRKRLTEAKKIKEEGLDSVTQPLGFPDTWIEAHLEYNRRQTAAAAEIPTYILHAGRGANIKRESLQLWKESIPSNNATFQFLNDLGHFMLPGTEPVVSIENLLFHDNVANTVVNSTGEWLNRTASE